MSGLLSRRQALAAVVAGLVANAGAAPPVTTLRIGMVQGMFRDVQPALVQAMSTPLRTIMTRQTGLDGKIDILPGPFAQAAKLDAGELQLGVFHGFEFAWVGEEYPDLVPLLVAIPSGRKVGAAVVVKDDSEIRSLADLTGDPITVPRGAKAHTLLYLERERLKLPTGAAKSKTSLGMTSEDAIDAVVIGDSPAALVDSASLAGYASLHPGAIKQVRVLAESRPFPPGVIAYKKGSLDAGMVARIRSGLATAHQTVAGRPLMALWNLRGFEEVPESYAEQLAEVRNAYPAPAVAGRK